MLFACVPLFAVLIGGGAVIAMEPIVSGIAGEGGEPSSRAVAVLFLGSAVYCALMVMAIKTATTLVAGWRLPGGDRETNAAGASAQAVTNAVAARPPMLIQGGMAQTATASSGDERVRGIVASLAAPADSGGGGTGGGGMGRARESAQIIPIGGATPPAVRIDHRVQGLGSRFRERPAIRSKEQIS